MPQSLLSRVRSESKTPEYRRRFLAALSGKMLGLVALGVIMATAYAMFGVHAGAQPAGTSPTTLDPAKLNLAPETNLVSAINTMWVLVAAFLVFFMQAGFMALEAGFARSKECVNIILEGIVDTALCGILFWAWGFAIMFCAGDGMHGLIGLGQDPDSKVQAAHHYSYFFLSNTAPTWWATGVPVIAFWLFQFAFADTCSTITSGAMLGRTGFVGDLLYSFCVSGIIYPIIGHWVWGADGFLVAWGFYDFAGSTVVHTIGGFIALAGAMALGPRLGRVFKRDGGGLPPAHDLVIASIGGVILWFGWYGFNPGSTLSAMDTQGIARVATNTTLAACAGALSSLFYVYPRGKIWDCGITVNGFLAGLVAITCPCYWVTPTGAIAIGLIAGVVVAAIDFIEWLRVDDPVGAVAVHGFCGIWGTVSLGLFASGQAYLSGAVAADVTKEKLVTGLFYGGGTHQLIVQILGSAIVTGATFGVALLMMYAVKATGTLRVSEKGEMEGLDLHEHGGHAYPEYQIIAMGGSYADTSNVMANANMQGIPPMTSTSTNLNK